MAGPHPALARVRSAIRADLDDLAPGAVVVVACSGGADSLALLAGTVFEARVAGWHVIGATVDHGLQEGSAEVAATVVRRMAAVGAAETLTARVRVESAGLGPEAAARDARYAVLDQVAERTQAACVLLGHTRDDQAETVLLGLARGAGGRSLAGMRRRFGRYRRPLLDLSREDTRDACAVQGLEWWEDPHNVDPGYARVRVRTRVLPVLEDALGPGVAAALARTADLVRDDVDLLDDLAEAEYAAAVTREADGVRLPVAVLEAVPRALRTRLLRAAALEVGAPPADLTHERITAIAALVEAWRGQRWVDLPGRVRARRVGGEIVLEPAPDGPDPSGPGRA